MGMGRKKDREKQQGLWVAASEIVTSPGHVFYERLNTVLNAEKFDQRVEAICRKYYKSSSGRPSITPGTYFRMLLLGYFEGIDSERGISWRAADSLSYRKFLGYDLSEPTPDHSTVSRTRRLYSVETHGAVMKWVLKILRKHGLADGQSVCIDGTTLEANAVSYTHLLLDTPRFLWHTLFMETPQTLADAIKYFGDPDNSLRYLAAKHWPNGIECPYCAAKEPMFLKSRRIWKCRATDCRKQFSVKVGDVYKRQHSRDAL